ncbi:MAG: hypothetical protein J6B34_04460 [Clostridia bacterium]|nr:hypothetical protein [Clostridia bacterium]
MEIFKGLIGNEDIKSTLGASIKNSEFLHAYIIEGPYGTGKRTVARLASASIMCKHRHMGMPCGECDTCKKILNDNCADVRFYDAFKIDEIRKIKESIYESSTECEYKVYILNDAQKMNVKAQNALLISLEEPPKNVVFFLLCTDASVLLETIRSRAQIVRTKPLSKDVILDYVMRNSMTRLSKEALEEIIISSNGSLGYTLDMLDEEKSKALSKDRERALSLVTSLLSQSSSTYATLSSMFQMTREKLKELFSLSLVVLRDLAVSKKSKNPPLCFFTSYEEADGIASKYSPKKILALYSTIERAIDDINTNASVPCTMASIITDFKRKGF